MPGRFVLHAKIHNATVCHAEPTYVGSITIDAGLLEHAGLWPGEGGSGVIAMNGAAAQRIGVGEQVIIMGFELRESPRPPTGVLVDAQNRLVRALRPLGRLVVGLAGG